MPKDPSNKYSENPTAVNLGHRIFFDKRFSSNGKIACASCHQPSLAFTDGLPTAKAIGRVFRNTPTLIGIAYSPWFFWDGRADSQWAQALHPLESPSEHGGTRTKYAKIIYEDLSYRTMYEKIFGPMADVTDEKKFPSGAAPINGAQASVMWKTMSPKDQQAVTGVFVNLGKVIASYERLLIPGPSRFDNYVDSLLNGKKFSSDQTLTDSEIEGLRLFIGKGACTQCHNGPLLTNNEFHNIGLSLSKNSEIEKGRILGAITVVRSEFNCFGIHSDADKNECSELDFIKLAGEDLLGGFKTPTLRNLNMTAPYMHDGQFATLNNVLKHYNKAPKATVGKSDILPLEMTTKELDQLKLFLLALSSKIDTDPKYLMKP